MTNATDLQQARPGAALAEGSGPHGGPGQFLLGIFETLERAGIPYCVMHGYENYPEQIGSDVDCLIAPEKRSGQLASLFRENAGRIGAEIVCCQDSYFVFAGKNGDGPPCFLALDLGVDYELGGWRFYSGAEVLRSRRRHHSFWVPAVDQEFACYLIKKVFKGCLTDRQAGRLSDLYRSEPNGCRQQVVRFWGAETAALLLAAARSGDWQPVRACLRRLRAELLLRATLRHPLRPVAHGLCRLANGLRRRLRPKSGLNVILLGPDGAGKSSLVAALNRRLGGAFARTARYSFPPGLLQDLLRRPPKPYVLPHALPPRSSLASALRAVGYWLVHGTLGYYLTVHPALARATLVLHDRHPIDALVDPRRYRYGGPPWLLRLVCGLLPRPDLVFLLDAPAEVVQARKQEVPLTETARQREAYRELVGALSYGHIVDAARPFDQVVGTVEDIILRHLASRLALRGGGSIV